MAPPLDSTRPLAGSISTHSRRTLLRAAAAGTAAVGLLGAVRALGLEVAAAGEVSPEGDGQSIVAYVSDAASGEIVVMAGMREVVRRDARLAGRLIAIAREATDVVAS